MNQQNPFPNVFGASPFGNLMNLVSQFNQFRNTFQGNGQQAQQQVQQIMQQNNIPQNVFDQYATVANQIMGMLGRRQ